MSIDFLYQKTLGRFLMKLIMRTGMFRVGSRFLKTNMSRMLIPGYIARHKMDMTPFEGQRYDSFAAFFARSKDTPHYVATPEVLVSPCDGLLAVFPISDEMIIPMKGSRYRLDDLIPHQDWVECYRDGLCLVFRLQAKDYHHFCCFDDANLLETHYIPGELHSVQPIACEAVPVYRLNRRWWSILETVHFETVIQIEVGAMMVGGVAFAKEQGWVCRGDEMGNFELAGSTIILLLPPSIKERLELFPPSMKTFGGVAETIVSLGEGIGVLRNET
ncbi:phosphatidylserine decarboxylase [Sphaerochaeta pleomorpha str. Grapes]|uniref:Phosphatidylserine decarboxylase n=1 Tax=Sphaerochaeta pleomorpha (strain ATCC BAA-1885 / DSM 22778 / Grapes) TaxID=158190 RepID=G8QX53_SPHPG|nr:phosphatidylserine decarboxylase [Sphaerochaeta pleomorpha]AEV30638.1 phosphatidylserine decarboxylase [Sphaerochaeta pleomorpha str. Grapes]